MSAYHVTYGWPRTCLYQDAYKQEPLLTMLSLEVRLVGILPASLNVLHAELELFTYVHCFTETEIMYSTFTNTYMEST